MNKENRIQKGTPFEPNPKMLKLLEAAINPEVEANISAWCDASGVSRSQWYRWQEVEGFPEWFNGEFRKALEGAKTALVKVGLQKALGGDFQFWRVMVEKLGEYTPSTKTDLKSISKAECMQFKICAYGSNEVIQVSHCCANKDHVQGVIWDKEKDGGQYQAFEEGRENKAEG